MTRAVICLVISMASLGLSAFAVGYCHGSDSAMQAAKTITPCAIAPTAKKVTK